MKSNALKIIEIEISDFAKKWESVELSIEKDAKLEAKQYVESAKVDLGGE